jgi:hypothetical protein
MTAASRKNVTTSPTLLAQNADFDGAPISFLFKNLDASASVDLGGATVATGAGYPLAAGGSIAWDLQPGKAVYAVAAAGVVVVAVASE